MPTSEDQGQLEPFSPAMSSFLGTRGWGLDSLPEHLALLTWEGLLWMTTLGRAICG